MLKIDTRYVLLQTMRGTHNRHTFYVDAVMDKKEEWFEAFIWEENYGVKELLVSYPIMNDTSLPNQIERFLERVENKFSDSAKRYLDNRNRLKQNQ